MKLDLEVEDITEKETKKGAKKILKLGNPVGDLKVKLTISGGQFEVSQAMQALQLQDVEEKVELEVHPTGQTRISDHASDDVDLPDCAYCGTKTVQAEAPGVYKCPNKKCSAIRAKAMKAEKKKK